MRRYEIWQGDTEDGGEQHAALPVIDDDYPRHPGDEEEIELINDRRREVERQSTNIAVVEADTSPEAMQRVHERLGWEPYRPFLRLVNNEAGSE